MLFTRSCVCELKLHKIDEDRHQNIPNPLKFESFRKNYIPLLHVEKLFSRRLATFAEVLRFEYGVIERA